MKSREEIMTALEACSDFCCGECPYQHLDSKEFSMRCIHTLIRDVNKMLKTDAQEIVV